MYVGGGLAKYTLKSELEPAAADLDGSLNTSGVTNYVHHAIRSFEVISNNNGKSITEERQTFNFF